MEPSHRKSWAAVDVCGIASFVAYTLPKEKRLPSHAHDRTGFADALGPARFVVIRLVRRCLAPRDDTHDEGSDVLWRRRPGCIQGGSEHEPLCARVPLTHGTCAIGRLACGARRRTATTPC